jgi:hypothetical protein
VVRVMLYFIYQTKGVKMFLQFAFIFVIGIVIGALAAQEIICMLIQNGINTGKIKFEVLKKGK